MPKNMKNADPMAVAGQVFVDAVEKMAADNGEIAKFVEAEVVKTKLAVEEQVRLAQASVQANVDAVTAAGDVMTNGAEQARTLVQGEVKTLIDGRIAAMKRIFGATTPMEAFDAQMALVRSEQAAFQGLATAMGELGQSVANDALKPVQAQVAENLKALNLKVA